MRLLLDTHIWVHQLLEPERLTRPVARAIDNPANELWLSAMSVVEVRSLIHKQRIRISADPAQWLQAATGTPIIEAPVTFEIAMASESFREWLPDPTDRILAATAQVLDLTLVTADTKLLTLRQIRLLADR